MTLARLRSRRDDILRIVTANGASNVRVFGSVARAGAGPESDVDLLVDLPSDCRGFDFFGVLDEMRENLRSILACEVDVLSIRGVTAEAQEVADRIRREAIPL
ncbi:MAG: nucleotidyltransferase family protein [Chloroflexota bacterium]|nr:MAG: nucleotidyltransferase [Chloroflexota bacterium]